MARFELPEDSHYLPDPDTAPDDWTRGAVEMANQAILAGKCSGCGGTSEHRADCPALTENIERHALQHGLSLDGMMTALYIRQSDGTYKRLLAIKPDPGF